MLFQFLVPAFAVILAAIFLGEGIVIGQIAGGVVIVAGILVARSPRFGIGPPGARRRPSEHPLGHDPRH
jgi:drug/metabolite transporter (DMT)-like permease